MHRAPSFRLSSGERVGYHEPHVSGERAGPWSIAFGVPGKPRTPSEPDNERLAPPQVATNLMRADSEQLAAPQVPYRSATKSSRSKNSGKLIAADSAP